MEPKPIVTCFGDLDLIGANLQKQLQQRLKALQLTALPRDDSAGFSCVCNGVEFMPLSPFTPSAASSSSSSSSSSSPLSSLPLYKRPALHTFWTGCCDMDTYRTHEKPLIVQWLDQLEAGGVSVATDCLVVYCITAQVRAKLRHRSMSIAEKVEERLRTDIKERVENGVISFRLASSDQTRLFESYQTFVSRVNAMCLGKFQREIEREQREVEVERKTRTDKSRFYDVFRRKLSLAVAYEMTMQHCQAMQLYTEALNDLECALSTYADDKAPPTWLKSIIASPCNSWDYPTLVWDNTTWKYLPAIEACSSPLLHTRTFFLVRRAHLLFVMEEASTVSQLCIDTLHAMAREISMLKLNLPPGAFDCWAYMTCYEAVQAIMTMISAGSMVSGSAASLLLVRAELWHYALEKLHAIGILCGLMPNSNVLNYDEVLVGHITAGFSEVDHKLRGQHKVDDQGKRLKEILMSKRSFHTAYLDLGDTVVGAFKYAGRRRMAFRVGSQIAQFQRDSGDVNKAEELLSDICRFYSEDQWTQLSTKAYSLLADCQLKLRLDDKYVGTTMLLASLPPYPGAAHDPHIWLNQLVQSAKNSPYQKFLNWDPLLEFVSLRPTKRTFNCEEEISIELTLRFLGPEEMGPLFVTLLLNASKPRLNGKSGAKLRSPSSSATSSSAIHADLQEIDLGMGDFKEANSRPIGETTKVRSSTKDVVHISRSDIESMSTAEVGSKAPEFYLVARGVILQPGTNKVTLTGKSSSPGEYYFQKGTLKFGSLDFSLSLQAKSLPSLAVLPSKVSMEVSLSSSFGFFLAGYPLPCELHVETGADTVVEEGAPATLIMNSYVHCTSTDGSAVPEKEPEDCREISFLLPSLPPFTRHSLPLALTFPQSALASAAQSHDQSEPSAWQYELVLSCDWLSPVHEAKLSVTVFDPISVCHSEHSAGKESSFLQLALENTCPVAVAVIRPALATDVKLLQIHSDIPEVFHPGDSFSCLWQLQSGNKTHGSIPDVATRSVAEPTPSTFCLQFRPLIEGKDTLTRDFKYNFMLSDMQTIFNIEASLAPLRDEPVVMAKRSSVLIYSITTFSEAALPSPIHYQVTYDPKQWLLQDDKEGHFSMDGPTKTLHLLVVPQFSGSHPFPCLALSLPPSTREGKATPLTSAQVYDCTVGELAQVEPFHLAAPT